MSYKRRAVLLLILIVAIVALASLDVTYEAARRVIDWADVVLLRHPIAGAALFIVLSAISAMVAFFSTAVVVPVAVEAWGTMLTIAFLWIGWLLGGSLSYFIGRHLGRRVVRWFIPDETLRPYEERLSGIISFGHVLLFQFALPSEVPGYVMGLLTYPFRLYLVALAIAEFPFAVGAVYLGESFLRRSPILMIALGVAGVAVTLVAASIFHRLFAGTSVPDHAAQPGGGGPGREVAEKRIDGP